jgi:hypothetical protein
MLSVGFCQVYSRIFSGIIFVIAIHPRPRFFCSNGDDEDEDEDEDESRG